MMKVPPKQIRLSRTASKIIASTPDPLKSTFRDTIQSLAKNPFSGIPLKGRLRGLYRERVGDFRIVYRFDDDCIEIVNIADRKDVYR